MFFYPWGLFQSIKPFQWWNDFSNLSKWCWDDNLKQSLADLTCMTSTAIPGVATPSTLLTSQWTTSALIKQLSGRPFCSGRSCTPVLYYQKNTESTITKAILQKVKHSMGCLITSTSLFHCQIPSKTIHIFSNHFITSTSSTAWLQSANHLCSGPLHVNPLYLTLYLQLLWGSYNRIMVIIVRT